MNLRDFIPASSFLDLVDTLTPAQKIDYNYYQILGNISRKLVEYRIDHNINQKQLSDLLGVTQSMISKYESGDYNISIRALNDLCGKLNLALKVEITPNVKQADTPSPQIPYGIDTIDDDDLLEAV